MEFVIVVDRVIERNRGDSKKRMLGQTFPRSRSFLSSPLTSLLKHLSSPSDSFLCRCVKELLKCHELSGLLIFPVFSFKRVKGEQNFLKKTATVVTRKEKRFFFFGYIY